VLVERSIAFLMGILCTGLKVRGKSGRSETLGRSISYSSSGRGWASDEVGGNNGIIWGRLNTGRLGWTGFAGGRGIEAIATARAAENEGVVILVGWFFERSGVKLKC
jgi:hypothetical protein